MIRLEFLGWIRIAVSTLHAHGRDTLNLILIKILDTQKMCNVFKIQDKIAQFIFYFEQYTVGKQTLWKAFIYTLEIAF